MGRCAPVGGLAIVLAVAGAGAADDLKKSGSIRIEQVQIAFIGSGNLGGGALQFGGKSYDFTVGGLGIGGIGIGGIGISKITTDAIYIDLG
jgi:hypothetical protein